MNIKIASDKTGLTKKAIKYYESEGLINPSKIVKIIIEIIQMQI